MYLVPNRTRMHLNRENSHNTKLISGDHSERMPTTQCAHVHSTMYLVHSTSTYKYLVCTYIHVHMYLWRNSSIMYTMYIGTMYLVHCTYVHRYMLHSTHVHMYYYSLVYKYLPRTRYEVCTMHMCTCVHVRIVPRTR